MAADIAPGMERDYEHDGRELLLRALTAMVERVESGSLDYPRFTGEDIVAVYKALVVSPKRFEDEYIETVKSGICDVLTTYFESELSVESEFSKDR